MRGLARTLLLTLLRDLAREVPIDDARLYVTGHSNGSMMAYRLAAEASPHVAALAVWPAR